jgi:hypothetical protein
MQRLLGKNYGSRNLSILHPPPPYLPDPPPLPPFVLDRIPPQIPNSFSGVGTGAVVVCAIA